MIHDQFTEVEPAERERHYTEVLKLKLMPNLGLHPKEFVPQFRNLKIVIHGSAVAVTMFLLDPR